MPFKARRPAGGFRIMYEYANRLSDLGYAVHITYPIKTQFMKYRLPYFVRVILSYVEGFRLNRWFEFRPNITMSYVKYIDEKYIADADVIIATWWATVLEVAQLSEKKGKLINLIQGFENWEGHIDLLYSSYALPNATNVVVASYLKDIVSAYSKKEVTLISNSIDNNQYYISAPIKNRAATSIAMLYSIQSIKGSKYGLEALHLVKQKYPDLQVDLFGICPKPEGLPQWMNFHYDSKKLVDIYNGNAIFVSNSLTEGFPLVVLEAMSCGCALICTNIMGHQECAFEGETALLVEVEDPKQMAERICYLIEHNDYRIDLAEKGCEYVKRFSWDVSVAKMENVIKGLIQEK